LHADKSDVKPQSVYEAGASVSEDEPRERAALRFIGCQPILDREQRTFGHELLFRSGTANRFTGDPDIASRQVIDSALTMGLEASIGNGKKFVNCTRESLIDGLVTLLPVSTTVLEVLETVQVDEAVIDACKRLRELGYQIALDDYVPCPGTDHLLEMADYVKLDLRLCDTEALLKIRQHVDGRGIALLAEKVETEAEFDQSVKDGFGFFQGYYFARPQMLSSRDIPANKMISLQLLSMVCQPSYDLDVVEKLLIADSSLCFRLLRLVNSAGMGLRHPVRTVRQAILMIGEDELAKLILIASAVTLGGDSKVATELIFLALARARFCELLARAARQSVGEQYLIGMMSVMDAMLLMPIGDILQMLPLRGEAISVLKGEGGLASFPLQVVQAYERQDWMVCDQLCTRMRISELQLTDLYAQSQRWAAQHIGRMGF
jgi:EAL and modified HD-GYP domain-containing signal transduction protein